METACPDCGEKQTLCRHTAKLLARVAEIELDLASTKAGLGEMVNVVLPRHRDLMQALRNRLESVFDDAMQTRANAGDLLARCEALGIRSQR